MIKIDNRGRLFELEEIYKYKDLIELTDKVTIKEIILNSDEKSMNFYNEFMQLVASEVAHEINKTEFRALKDKLIAAMEEHLES